MQLKSQMSGYYRQLRSSGMSHEQAFSQTGSHFKKISQNHALMRAETRMIKPVDMSNAKAVRTFTKRFDYGVKEKTEFMKSKDEIGSSDAFKTVDYLKGRSPRDNSFDSGLGISSKKPMSSFSEFCRKLGAVALKG